MYELEFHYLLRKGNKVHKKKGSISFKNPPKSYQEFCMRLGLVIAYIREYMGISQNELSKKVGVNLFEVEQGLRDITTKKLFALGDVLHVDAVMLIAFTYCGDGEWTEENMKEKVNAWKKLNKAERRKSKFIKQ